MDSPPETPASSGKKSEDDADLTTLLSEAHQKDLTLLIAEITASMRKRLVDNFDPVTGLILEIRRHPKNLTPDERMAREKKLKQQYDEETGKPATKALRKDVIAAFDEWRKTVLLRVGQAVKTEDYAKELLDNVAMDGTSAIGAAAAVGSDGTLKFKDMFPPTKTPLTKLKMNERTLVLHSVLLLLLGLEHYNAPSRILLLHMTSSLKLPLKTFEQDEYATAKGLLEAAKEMTADEETKKKIAETRDSRKWKVGLATVAGATIIGVTGGMAAPLVAAGVGSVMGGLGLGATAAAGYLGSVAGSTLVVGSLFGAFGGRITGQMMDNYAKEVEDFAFIPVHSSNKTSEDHEEGAKEASDHDHKLRVTICISGWLTDKEEVVKPWTMLGTGAEVFAMRYELEALLNLGHSMDGLVKSAAWGAAQKQAVASTMFADLAAALWPIALTKVARVIDNPFSVAMSRSDKAGEVLADALINKAQGERPVSLIGYSLGSRVIYTCLMSLAKRNAFGLIENVVLMGAPAPADTSDWRVLRSVVSGRLVNVYSDKDRVLGFMYRASNVQNGVAGLQSIEGLVGVENFDVSVAVSSHLQYRYLTGDILRKIGFKDIDLETIEQEHVEMEKMEKEEKEESKKSQRKQLQRRNTNGGKADEAEEGEHEANELQKQVAANTQKSLKARIIEWWMTPNVPTTKDAEKLAANTAANAKTIAQDPTQAGAVAGNVVEDVQSSTESYAQWAMRKLPSMPGTKRGPVQSVKKTAADPSEAIKDVSNLASNPTEASGAVANAAKDVKVSTETYTQWAVKKLPITLTGGSKTNPGGDVRKSATEASKAVSEAPKAVGEAAFGLKNAAGDTVPKALGRTTSGVKEAAAAPPKTVAELPNVATDTAKGVQDVISDPSKVAENVSDVTNDTANSVRGYASYLPSIPGMSRKQSTPQDAPVSAPESTKESSDLQEKLRKAPEQVQQHTANVASFLPSLPGTASRPSLPKTPSRPNLPKTTSRPQLPKTRSQSQSTSIAPTLESATKVSDTVKDGSSKAVDEAKSSTTDIANTAAKIAAPATNSARSLASKSPKVDNAVKKPPNAKQVGDVASSTASSVGKTIPSTASRAGEQVRKSLPGVKSIGNVASPSACGISAGSPKAKRSSEAATKSVKDAGATASSVVGNLGAKSPVPKAVGTPATKSAKSAGSAVSTVVGKAAGTATSAGKQAAVTANSAPRQASQAVTGLTSSLTAPKIPASKSSVKPQAPSTPPKPKVSANTGASPSPSPKPNRKSPAKLTKAPTNAKSPLAERAKTPSGVKSPGTKSSPKATSPQVLHVKGSPRKQSGNVVTKLPALGTGAVKSASGMAGAGLQRSGSGVINVAKKGGEVGTGVADAGGSAVKAGGRGLGKLRGLVGFGKK